MKLTNCPTCRKLFCAFKWSPVVRWKGGKMIACYRFDPWDKAERARIREALK